MPRSILSLGDLPLPDPGRPDVRSALRYLVWVARRQWRTLALGVTWGTVWMVAQGVVPAALGVAVAAAAEGNVTGTTAAAAAVLALGAVQTGAGVLRHRMAVTNWIVAASRTQQLVVRQATRLGDRLSREVATGEVVAVTSSDVEKIGSAFDVLARLAGAVVAFAGVATVLLMTSPLLGGLVLVGAPVLAAAVGPLLGPLEQRESTQRERLGRASAVASDTVAGLRVLRGIGGEDLFLRRFTEASQRVRGAAVEVAKVRSVLDSLQVALPGILLVAVLWIGAHQVLQGNLTVGQLVAFYGYSAFLVLPLRTFTEAAHRWTSAYVAARRVVRLLGIPVDAQPDSATGPAPDFGSAVIEDPVTGLRLAPGTTTGVVCSDQDAAHALAARLGGEASGREPVTVGAVPLPTLGMEAVRAGILVQDKEPALLSGTLAAHFDVPRSGRVRVSEAVAAASAHDVLDVVADADPDADGDPLTARITERGRSLSGGQRQRLALARSLVVDPAVLVLDEPTSAVDAHTEARIALALRGLRAGRTTVLLTSSPLLLDRCDTVAFVDGGHVVGTGPHRELLAQLPHYRAFISREQVSTA